MLVMVMELFDFLYGYEAFKSVYQCTLGVLNMIAWSPSSSSCCFLPIIRKLNKFSLPKIKLCCFCILLLFFDIMQYARVKMGEERVHGSSMQYGLV